MQKVFTTYQSKGLKVVAITSDELDSIKRVKKAKSVTFPVLRDPEDKISEKYGIIGIPRTLIVDKDGMVRVDITGEGEFEQFKEHLKKVGLGE